MKPELDPRSLDKLPHELGMSGLVAINSSNLKEKSDPSGQSLLNLDGEYVSSKLGSWMSIWEFDSEFVSVNGAGGGSFGGTDDTWLVFEGSWKT